MLNQTTINSSLQSANSLKNQSLVVGGLTPFTTIDFPGKLAAVVFCQGCPWQCAYCHNTHLRSTQADQQTREAHEWSDIKTWLKSRRGLLDGVVFSGGEPLLQRYLPEAVSSVKNMGFSIALHTAGIYPDRLASMLPDLDWVGFDIKAPFDQYHRIVGANGGEKAKQSLALLIASGKKYEVRCTVDMALLSVDDLSRMAEQIAEMGVSSLILQTCRDSGLIAIPLAHEYIEAAKKYLKQVTLRAA